MKSRWVVLILLLIILFLVAMNIFKDAQIPLTRVIEVPVQTQEDYGVQLRLLHDTVFGALDAETPNATAQVHKLRNAAILEREQPGFASARASVVIEICDFLTWANQEREYCESKLRDTRSLVRHSLSRTSEQQRLDLERQRLLAESVYLQRWGAYVSSKRPISQQLLLRLYRMEHSGQSSASDHVHPNGSGRTFPSN